MHTLHARHETSDRTAVTPTAPSAAADTPLTGIERLMADALMALDREPPGAMSEPGAIEYASWVRMLRRSTP